MTVIPAGIIYATECTRTELIVRKYSASDDCTHCYANTAYAPELANSESRVADLNKGMTAGTWHMKSL